MSDRSKIEWTDASWNPLRASLRLGGAQQIGWHCEHVTEACRNCYAEAINRRLGTGLDFKPGNRAALDLFLDEKTLVAPLHWRKPRKIFPCSMTDLFGDWVTDEQLDRIFAVMALAPQHTFIVLTKRPERMREYLRRRDAAARWVQAAAGLKRERSCYAIASPDTAARWSLEGLPNVWLLVSICDQPDADKFIPILLDTPAAVRGVSYEPALGPVSFRWAKWQPWKERGTTDHLDGLRRLDWVICGGESGPHARLMHPQWARDVRDECAEAGVPFFFKQWGRWQPFALKNNAEIKRNKFYVGGRGYPFHQIEGYAMVDIGKKGAGRRLDGMEHNGFPQVANRSEAA